MIFHGCFVFIFREGNVKDAFVRSDMPGLKVKPFYVNYVKFERGINGRNGLDGEAGRR